LASFGVVCDTAVFYVCDVCLFDWLRRVGCHDSTRNVELEMERKAGVSH
jgi:hypothetical protein